MQLPCCKPSGCPWLQLRSSPTPQHGALQTDERCAAGRQTLSPAADALTGASALRFGAAGCTPGACRCCAPCAPRLPTNLICSRRDHGCGPSFVPLPPSAAAPPPPPRVHAEQSSPAVQLLLLLRTLRPCVSERSPMGWVCSQVVCLTSLPRASLATWPPPPPPTLQHAGMHAGVSTQEAAAAVRCAERSGYDCLAQEAPRRQPTTERRQVGCWRLTLRSG